MTTTPLRFAHAVAAALLCVGALAVLAGARPSSAGATVRPDEATARPAGATVRPANSARTGVVVVSYRGVRLTVPSDWPVISLSRSPRTCVRFNRHALYLGRVGTDAACPASAVGRTEALLVEPLGSAPAGLELGGGSVTDIVDRRARVRIVATWNSDPAVIARAVGVRAAQLVHAARLSGVARLPRTAPLPRPAPLPHAAPLPRVTPGARSAERSQTITTTTATTTTSTSTPSPTSPATATPGEVYDGKGFDACSAPSTATMSDWATSPYRAVGVYIGGANVACAQSNLTPGWVSTESAAGWHLIPVYVGLQAPGSACGCATITPADATTEGTDAAIDAADQAAALGLGAGNPIEFDMEAYSTTAAHTAAVLAFLSAWTTELHAEGYLSGVYSSDDSGISDLVAQYGTSFPEPDQIWFAHWNGSASVADSGIPAADWADAQRLHQYVGGTNATYGGATLNIDEDFLDAATAAAGTNVPVTAPTSAPVASGPPVVSGTPVAGMTLTVGHAAWSDTPTGYAEQWEVCQPSGTQCAAVPGATGPSFVVPPADVGSSIAVLETATNALGSTESPSSNLTAPVAAATSGYWRLSTAGAVYPSTYEPSFGSPYASGVRGSSFVGLATSAGARGYWIAGRSGHVYAYGGAGRYPAARISAPVLGIVGAPSGGYWLYTATGAVAASRGTPSFGSAAALGLRTIAAMAATVRGRGYWLITRSGGVLAFGTATRYRRLPVIDHEPIIGAVTAPGGFWAYTAAGSVFASSRATRTYGSPAASHLRGVGRITGMLATPDGHGYWLVSATGTVYSYGDARRYVPPAAVAGTSGSTTATSGTTAVTAAGGGGSGGTGLAGGNSTGATSGAGTTSGASQPSGATATPVIIGSIGAIGGVRG